MKTRPEYSRLFPPLIEFGWGVSGKLPRALERAGCGAAPRVLLVTSRVLACTGRLETFERLCGGNVCAHCADVPHDPPLAAVERLVAMARSSQCEAVVAVGGGSVIDAAKAAAVLVPAPAGVAAYFHGGMELPGPGLPVIALPTTAGTGAEITSNAVLTDPALGVKKSLRSPFMVPAAALIDPELTVTLPPAVTASSGLDALTQAVEAYLSRRAQAVSCALAAEAIGLLMAQLPAAYRDGRDREARIAVAEGSLLSALAFSQSGLGAVHGLAHPIGLALDLSHGLTCAVLLPHVLAWNAPACTQRLQELAAAVGVQTPAAFIAAVRKLCQELGVPADFAAAGLGPGLFDAIVANCRSGSMAANPRPMRDDDVRQLLARLAGAPEC